MQCRFRDNLWNLALSGCAVCPAQVTPCAATGFSVMFYSQYPFAGSSPPQYLAQFKTGFIGLISQAFMFCMTTVAFLFCNLTSYNGNKLRD